MRAWEKLDRFHGSGRFRAWLFALAWRAFLTRGRRRTREAEVMAEYAHEVTEATEDDERLPDLEPLLALLGETERNCLLLTHAWGMSVAETAQVLDMPSGTVKSHVHRAKRKLASHHGAADARKGACSR